MTEDADEDRPTAQNIAIRKGDAIEFIKKRLPDLIAAFEHDLYGAISIEDAQRVQFLECAKLLTEKSDFSTNSLKALNETTKQFINGVRDRVITLPDPVLSLMSVISSKLNILIENLQPTEKRQPGATNARLLR